MVKLSKARIQKFKREIRRPISEAREGLKVGLKKVDRNLGIRKRFAKIKKISLKNFEPRRRFIRPIQTYEEFASDRFARQANRMVDNTANSMGSVYGDETFLSREAIEKIRRGKNPFTSWTEDF